MELELEEVTASLAEDDLTAEHAVERQESAARMPQRRSGPRRPLPEHLPREHILVPGPCACCGSIRTARLNGVDPQAWLADVLARINEHSARDLDALMPWNRRQQRDDQPVAEAA